MTLTREQIEVWRKDAPATRQMMSSEDFRALCDLALAAADMREMAAKVCEAMAKEHDHGTRYAFQDAAIAIRALPTPEEESK